MGIRAFGERGSLKIGAVRRLRALSHSVLFP